MPSPPGLDIAPTRRRCEQCVPDDARDQVLAERDTGSGTLLSVSTRITFVAVPGRHNDLLSLRPDRRRRAGEGEGAEHAAFHAAHPAGQRDEPPGQLPGDVGEQQASPGDRQPGQPETGSQHPASASRPVPVCAITPAAQAGPPPRPCHLSSQAGSESELATLSSPWPRCAARSAKKYAPMVKTSIPARSCIEYVTFISSLMRRDGSRFSSAVSIM